VYAGLRPLLAGEARPGRSPHSMDEHTSKLSREHAVVEPMLGLMLVAGGKYTTYRVMAADVIDRAARRLGPDVPSSHTDQLPLLGADGYYPLWSMRADVARRHGLATGVFEHLLERYGSLSLELLALIAADPTLGRPVEGAPEYLAAEIVYAASHEGALHLEDVLIRRTRISIETAHRGVESAQHAAQLMGPVLGWDETRRELEVEHYHASVAAERQSQQMPDDLSADAARMGAPAIRQPLVAGL